MRFVKLVNHSSRISEEGKLVHILLASCCLFISYVHVIVI